VVHGCRI